ncbi:fimbrial protein [Cutibacterium sp. WCA-380-WT-3A]|uniref:Fimbrial protein n=1 Tax=Cutibacterium porci TaxID=2605781 RepID=A0A7K0J9F9_9ACTN|nr:CAMP factor family pore-forming toxin [Cutibacterium porci]MSS46614.1 fimbrial protein [Cutibacterium porci]
MKKTCLVTPLLVGAMLMPAALSTPSAHAVEPTATVSTATSAHALSASDARHTLQLLDARIASLQSMQKAFPGSDYSDQIRDLLKTAFDLRGLIETIAHGGIPFYDPATIMPRVKLVATTVDTIHTATTTLQNKVRPAHVELGLEVTKAVLLTINPASTAKELDAEASALKARLAKVSQYPDLTPNDVATIYVRANFGKTIWQVRANRDKYILGHKSAAVYKTLNGAITKAVGVKLDPKATVGKIQAARTDLLAAYQTALHAPDVKKTA